MDQYNMQFIPPNKKEKAEIRHLVELDTKYENDLRNLYNLRRKE
jgi:hypothetical protein